MKTTLFLLVVLTAAGLGTALVDGTCQGATVTLTAEVDKPVLLADGTQTAYLRVGLTGCPLERLRTRTPLNVALVIDKSGSMGGEKIRKAKEAAILAVRRLGADDIVSVVVYDSGVRVVVPATKLTRREDVIGAIREITAGGSTALYDGVKTGGQEVEKFQSANRVNRIVLLSDGLANVGPQSPKALGKLGSALAETGISVTTIGLGLGYNEDLMSRLAYMSDGGHYFAETADELASVFDREFDRALSVVAQEVRIEIICGEKVRPVRILGREGTIEGRTIVIDLGSVYSAHEKYVLVEVETPAGEAAELRELADVRLRYQDMGTQKAVALKGQAVDVRYTASKADVEEHLNKRVAADAVEQIAILENERATALRDAGKVEEAREVLAGNAAYLRSNAAPLCSPALEKYAEENEQTAEQLDEADWGRQRKVMRESQTSRKTQQ